MRIRTARSSPVLPVAAVGLAGFLCFWASWVVLHRYQFRPGQCPSTAVCPPCQGLMPASSGGGGVAQPQATGNGSLVQRLWQYESAVSMRDLRRGVTWGDSARLRRFTNKLLSGQPVSVGLLGSSVTAGQGAEFGGPYSRRFFQFVNTTFPHPGHVFKNGAFGGSTSLLFSVCGTSVLPKGVDLVVVEFALNDGMDTTDIKTPQRKAYERLLRGLLMMPNRPAIILLHFYAYLRAESNYWRSSEADHSVIGGYYGLPQLSVRAAFYRHMAANKPGYKVHTFHREHENETTPEDTFYYDPVHPQDKTGHRYMAELLIGALRLTAQGLLREPLSQEDEQVAQEPLPRPLNPNNYERHTQSCVLQREFEQNMVQQQGFEFINERPPKPGVTDTIDQHDRQLDRAQG